jgi:threonine dehydratase
MSSMLFDRLTSAAVAEAATVLDGVANRTAVVTSRTLNNLVGCDLFLKCENFQRVGAFKFRGAYNAVSRLSQEQRKAGVITHSSGNHAQALALAASLFGVRSVIVMPEDAPAIKKEATAGYGAEIIACPAVAREEVCAREIEAHGYTLVHPYDNNDIIAGAGTAAWELFEETGPLDALFVPVGGGGLISGSALAAAQRSPSCKVIGVEPEVGADANQSWRDGSIHTLSEVPDTMADGLRTRMIGARNLHVMSKYVSDMTVASESEIWDALRFLWMRLKIVVEPSAAVALAPLFSGRYKIQGRRVGAILSGGNVDMLAFRPRLGQDEAGGAPLVPPSLTRPAAEKAAVPRVLLTDPMDAAGLEILEEVSAVELRQGLSQEELLADIGKYHALIVGSRTQVPEQLIEYGFNLRAIGTLTSRLDNIDVSTARNMGIEVCSAPSSRAVTLAENTLSRMLRLAAELAEGQLAGKTLGIIGFGRVGQQVARRAQAFDMRVMVNQPRLTPQLALSTGVNASDLPDLLRQSDYVTLHVPFRVKSQIVIGAAELNLMKESAFLINTGHTGLVDEMELRRALQSGRIAGAALSQLPRTVAQEAGEDLLRQLPNVFVWPHVSDILSGQQRQTALAVAEQIAALLRSSQANETLSLRLAAIENVLPHEQVDPKRVKRLMKRLTKDGRLVNPPVTTHWKGRYIILDGATRYTALKQLGFPHIIVQVVEPVQAEFELHTWYHLISGSSPFSELRALLQEIDGLTLTSFDGDLQQDSFRDENALCYLLSRNGDTFLASVAPGASRLVVQNELVDRYSRWGRVERTLLTDLPALVAQFPEMVAVALYPQFSPEAVFEGARGGGLLPAGLTRFVIPGRVLRLNADLERLRRDETLADKQAWLNRFLEDKLARSRMRYYQEPVILLDE